MKKTFFFAVFFAFLFAACSDSSDKTSIQFIEYHETIDQSTPDNAVKAFLQYRKFVDSNFVKIQKRNTEFYKSTSNSFYTKEASDTINADIDLSFKKITTNHKERIIIKKVDIQSDSHAFVYVPSENILGQVSESRFVMTKVSDKWLIEDRQDLCWNCKGTGTVKDYSSYSYSSGYKDKDCDYCKGTGWNSRIFQY